MKNFIFILLLVTATVYSQEPTNTITVIGETEKQVEAGFYHLAISLREIVPDGYQSIEPKSLSQVRQMYIDKLKSVGIDFSKFKENNYMYLYMSISETRDSAYYSYLTTSYDDIDKIVKQRMAGLSIVNVEIIAKEKTIGELAELTQAAIEDATLKAEKIVSKLNKKLGGIAQINDSNTEESYLDYYRSDMPLKHMVTVVFNLQ